MKKEDIKTLKEVLRKADYKVYHFVRHVSSSGMLRVINFFTVVNNEPFSLNWYIEQLGLYKRDKDRDGLRVSGCGMDMGFSVVYDLGRALYPKGFKIRAKDRNRNAVNGMKPTEEGYNWDIDGGYRLTSIWV